MAVVHSNPRQTIKLYHKTFQNIRNRFGATADVYYYPLASASSTHPRESNRKEKQRYVISLFLIWSINYFGIEVGNKWAHDVRNDKILKRPRLALKMSLRKPLLELKCEWSRDSRVTKSTLWYRNEHSSFASKENSFNWKHNEKANVKIVCQLVSAKTLISRMKRKYFEWHTFECGSE